jgi:hypothetical protein
MELWQVVQVFEEISNDHMHAYFIRFLARCTCLSRIYTFAVYILCILIYSLTSCTNFKGICTLAIFYTICLIKRQVFFWICVCFASLLDLMCFRRRISSSKIYRQQSARSRSHSSRWLTSRWWASQLWCSPRAVLEGAPLTAQAEPRSSGRYDGYMDVGFMLQRAVTLCNQEMDFMQFLICTFMLNCAIHKTTD